ncbi:hypothetical protein SZ54_2332 [Rhizobium sp. UR51a]|nr:hypothetical protein SZ54_2332 [Rhizobium sp. UR51a]
MQGNTGELVSSLFSADSLNFEIALQKAISANNTTEEELAKVAGVSSISVDELRDEDKRPEIDVDRLQKLAAALQAPVPLFVGKGVTALLERRSNPAASEKNFTSCSGQQKG